MSIFLTTASGEPLNSFGGSSQWAQGTTNDAEFSSQPNSLFGWNLNRGDSATTPAAISSTTASSTSDLGYQDAADAAPGAHNGMMQPETPPPGTRQLNATYKSVGKLDKTTPMGAAIKKAGTPEKLPGQQVDKTPPNPAAVIAGKVAGAGQAAWNQYQQGRNANAAYGAAEAVPGQKMPGGMFGASGTPDDTIEDVT